MPIFSEHEIKRRIDLIGAGLASRSVDAVLLTSADHVYYATGMPLLSEWGRPMWAVVTSTGTSTIIGAAIERETMGQEAVLSEVVTYDDERNVHAAVLASAAERLKSAATVGIEKAALPVAVFDQLAEALPQAQLVDISDVLFAARIHKSPEEERLLRIGGQVAQIGASAFVEALSPGISELDVAGHAIRAMHAALSALYPEGITSSYVYAQFGAHSLSPHLHPTGTRLRRGDIVALNVFPVVTGYCVELERTLVYGAPTEAQSGFLEILDSAFTAGKEMYKPGVSACDLDAACTKVITDAGLAKYIRHGTGHAHGIMVGAASREDLGELRPYNTTVLEPGMTNSIEPGFYLPESGGYRHSDVMIMGQGAAECITEFPTAISF